MSDWPFAAAQRRWSARWHDLSLPLKTFAVVIVPIMTLSFTGLATVVLELQERESEAAVRRAYQARTNVFAVYVALLNAETGVRGFLLTREDAFLDPFRTADRAAPGAMRRLQDAAMSPEGAAHADRLTTLVERRLANWHTNLASGDSPTALAASLREGKAIMDEIQQTLAAMLSIETRQIEERSLARDELLRRNRWFVGSSVIGGVGGGLVIAWLFMAGLAGRVNALEHDARRLAGGQPLEPPRRASRDAVGRLEATLQRASALLMERERELRHAAEAVRDLYEHAPCGYHSLDATGTVIRMNATELRWLGYDAHEVIGLKGFPDLITEASRADFARLFPGFKRDGILQDAEFELVRKDGSILPVSLSASAIYGAEGQYVASRSTVFDITARRTAERAVTALNAELQRQLDTQAALNHELEAFSYSVSHDLRAPLRSIDGFAQALVEDCADQLDEAGRAHLARVRAAAQRMGRLIDDMLMLSRVTRSELRLARVDISALAAEIAQRCNEQAPARAVAWHIQPGLEVVGDHALLQTALENLLANAWKFTSRTPGARIAVEPAGAPPGYAGIAVRDNGAGFDMRYADKLFGAFQRLHNAADFPGTGIGLAIVQRVVAKHGGSVRAEGVPDAGATVTVILPARAMDTTGESTRHA